MKAYIEHSRRKGLRSNLLKAKEKGLLEIEEPFNEMDVISSSTGEGGFFEPILAFLSVVDKILENETTVKSGENIDPYWLTLKEACKAPQ